MELRNGSPRVGDTIAVSVGRDQVQTVVTQVLVRRVKQGEHVADWHAVKTATFGMSGFRRGRPNYPIVQGA